MKHIFIVMITLIFSLGCPATVVSDTIHSEWVGFVKSSSLNMRSGPGSEYKIVERIPNKDKVDIVNESYDPSNSETWVEVRYNGKTGYVSTEYLSIQKNLLKRHHYDQKHYTGLSFVPVPPFMPKSTPLWLWNLGLITLILTIVFWIVFHKNDFISPFRSALAVALSCGVIYYSICFGEYALWFFSLTETGNDIGFLLLNGLLIAILIIVQFLLSFSIYSEYAGGRMFPSYAPVVIGGACFLISLIISNFWIESFFWVGVAAVILGEIAQCAMVWEKTNGLTAVSIMIVSTATIMLCVPLLYIAAAVAAVMIAKGMSSTSGSHGSSRGGISVPSHSTSMESEEEKTFLTDSNGKKVEVELDISGMNAVEKNSMMPRRFRKRDDGSFEEH